MYGHANNPKQYNLKKDEIVKVWEYLGYRGVETEIL